MDNQLRQIIEEAWNDRALLAESRVREAVRAVIEELDKGRLRTAEPIDPSRSQWQVNEWVKKRDSALFSDAGDAHHAGRRTRMARQNGPQARLRGAGRTGCTARRGALRSLHFAGGDPDALLRQYRSLGRCRHDGRYVGDGRLLRPGRRARPPERRCGRGRCAGTRAGGPRHHRGRLFHRLPGHRGRSGRTSAANRCWAPAW